MKITDVKVNGMINPIGFAFKEIKISWKTMQTKSRQQEFAVIRVAKDAAMNSVITEVEGKELSSIGTYLKLKLMPRTRYYLTIEVTGNLGDHAVSKPVFFETGKSIEEWQAEWIMSDKEYHPEFVHRFTVFPIKIAAARIYISGLGLYEASLNQKKIGNEYLTPNCNDYNQKIQYQTYDITGFLNRGGNEIVITLGNGWYKGRLGYEGVVSYYGNKFMAIAEIHIIYADGSEQVIGTDSGWKYRPSDILESDIYDGEVYDHLYWKQKAEEDCVVCPDISYKKRLVERYSVPVVVKETLSVKEILHTPKGETVLDFGQNFAGFVSFHSKKLPVGERIVLEHGEILQDGNFYNENYRSAKARFIYVADGRDETVRAHFTYYGFRYVRVSGWTASIERTDFIGNVLYSDLESVSSFVSTNAKLNRLVQNVHWGQKSNFVDMPTDCPQRDERLGWTGDAQVFAPTACFHMDSRIFYRKFLDDLRTEQIKMDGAIPNYIPNLGNLPGGACAWGDAATFIPMTLYQHYGDLEELRHYYPMMKDWVDWIVRQDEGNGGHHLWDFGFQFGDWLALDGITEQSMKGGTDDYYIASMYYYQSTKKLAQAAGYLGITKDENDYTERANRIYEAILNEYFSPTGKLCIDTQTGYLLALDFKVYRDKNKVLEGLKCRLKKDCYKIRCGFVGATMICRVLAENGMQDLAYHLLLQEEFPGWIHCINLGATTVWERWNSVMDDGRISATGMNSLNHYSYGAVLEFVYCYIAGIQGIQPGYKRVQFAPQIDSRLTQVDFFYNSVSGKYRSFWKINLDGTVTVRFEVPFGCSGIAILPESDEKPIELCAGVFEKTYMPKTDVLKKYTMNTRLGEFCKDESAMKILQEKLPAAYHMALSGDKESLGLCLNDLLKMFYLGIQPEDVQLAAEQLFQIKAVV